MPYRCYCFTPLNITLNSSLKNGCQDLLHIKMSDKLKIFLLRMIIPIENFAIILVVQLSVSTAFLLGGRQRWCRTKHCTKSMEHRWKSTAPSRSVVWNFTVPMEHQNRMKPENVFFPGVGLHWPFVVEALQNKIWASEWSISPAFIGRAGIKEHKKNFGRTGSFR